MALVAFIVGFASQVQKSCKKAIGNGFLGALFFAAVCRLIVILCDLIYHAGLTKPVIIGAILVSAVIAFGYSTAGDTDDHSKPRKPTTPKPDEDDDEEEATVSSSQPESDQPVGRIGGRITLY